MNAAQRQKKLNKQRQRYYEKEYDRLITQAKKLYNMMNLGSAFGKELPSFEKILNYAGTRSGLKKPTKASIKALRKLQGEEGILWGIEHTVSKKAVRAKALVQEMRSDLSEAETSVKKAKKAVKKSFVERELKGVDDKAQKAFLDAYFSDVDRVLAELRYYKNYCSNEYNAETGKRHRRSGDTQRMQRLKIGYDTVSDLLDELEGILHSGNEEKIKAVVKNAEAFYNKHADGFSIIEFYAGRRQITFDMMNDMSNMSNVGPEESPSFSSDEPAVNNEIKVTAEADDLIRAIEESGLYDEPDEIFGFPD